MTERAPDATILAALHESEERYRFLSETIPVQIWTSLPDGQLDYVSEQTARSFGLSPAQLLRDGWQNVLHPDDLPLAVQRWTHALTTGDTYEIEFRLKDAAGEYAWHLARAVPQRNSAGAIVRWFGTNTNIEDQRRYQREVEGLAARLREKNSLLALEAEVGVVLTRAGSRVDALRTCAEAIVRHVGASFARIWTINESGTVLELQVSAGLYTHVDGPHGRVPVGTLKIGQIAAQKKPHFTNQVVGDTRVGDQEWARREGMIAFAGYPIIFGDKVIGVIAAFAKSPLSEASLKSIGSVANALAQSLERRRAEEQLLLREAWLSTTLSSIGDGVIATDSEGRITFLNPVASALTGWAPDEALGKPLDSVLPLVNEDTRSTVESPVAKVLREGTIVGLANHTLLLRRDGTEVPIDDSAAPIREPGGALIGVVLVFRDAGEKRRVEAERIHLLAQEQRARLDADAARADLHSLFMQAPAPICILRGPQHTFALANPMYMQRVGTHRKILGLPVREALPEVDGQGFFELLDRVYATGERHTGKDVPATIDQGGGTPRAGFVTFTYEPFRDVDGQVAGILVVAFDVTEAVVARESLQANLEERERLLASAEDAREKADFASRAKDEFLTTASHELRTPLNAILGWAQLLRSGSADPSGFLRGLETIERNAKAQVELIEDILDGSRIITGNLHLEIRSVDLTALVHAAIDSVRPAAAAKGISLDVRLDPAASRILGDPDRLQQVVWNLVNNALKFTPKGGAVAVRVDRVGTSIELAVEDDGKGITSEFLPYVFERFRQADGSTTRRHGGLGLGLALVRHLAEAHGGSVRATSPGEGLGATFTVTLPVQAVFPEALEVVRAAAPRSDGGRASPVPNSLYGVSVLVVDDELDARELVATLLRAQGAEVLMASSVKQAIEILGQRSPSVLVSDIGMPGADGYTLIGSVRALQTPVSGIPALALTAYAREEDRRRALEAGFQTYLAKPAEPDALVRAVGELAASVRR